MRAVWSFWSKPFHDRHNTAWSSPFHHLLAWGLSVSAARRHFSELCLITDSEGKRLLADKLGLPFTEVHTELDTLRHVDSRWWALGKLVAYSMQQQPFAHLDTDVFLWKPLAPAVAEASVFAQCPELHNNDPHCYQNEIERAFADHGGTLPVEWEWSAPAKIRISARKIAASWAARTRAF